MTQDFTDRASWFEAEAERLLPDLYGAALRLARNDADAQDLTATTFERAMGAIHRFQPVGGGMVAWLIRIARNAHSDTLRRQRRRGTEVANDGAEPAIDPSDDAVILRSLVDDLPRAQQDAIQLRFAAGLTAREIGGVLGISEAAAQKQVERGLRALKEAYGDD